jgi:hypothetical protein
MLSWRNLVPPPSGYSTSICLPTKPTEYVTAAKSFDTAASVKTPIAGIGAARKIEEAVHSGFAACKKGGRLFADAAVEGFGIKQAAG